MSEVTKTRLLFCNRKLYEYILEDITRCMKVCGGQDRISRIADIKER
jgi:hypothetical protein